MECDAKRVSSVVELLDQRGVEVTKVRGQVASQSVYLPVASSGKFL